MNAHIWEVDGCENKNSQWTKENINVLDSHILNCVRDGLSVSMWFTKENDFTLVWKELSESVLDKGC